MQMTQAISVEALAEILSSHLQVPQVKPNGLIKGLRGKKIAPLGNRKMKSTR